MSESGAAKQYKGWTIENWVFYVIVYFVLGLARILRGGDFERGVPFHLRKIKLIVPIQLECTVRLSTSQVYSLLELLVVYKLVHFRYSN